MGVPAFYRWLSEKYPKIVADMLEQRAHYVDGVEIPLNLNEPNPNGIEYDNLYIDMNGLIHPCSHPEDRETPSSEFEMYVNVTKYVDRIFACVRPRRLLYLAIDGVAPRAKMNQQRSRRSTSFVLLNLFKRLLKENSGGGSEWDSNVITPGTEFMYRLSVGVFMASSTIILILVFYCDQAWRRIKVVFSDASEPGEGEHKIMRFIRSQRCQPDYDPNQRHILHGLDADLIMLALATHEPLFTILREKVTFGKKDRDSHGSTSQSQRLLDGQTGSQSDYLTSPGGVVNLSQAGAILNTVGKIEDIIFQRRKAAEQSKERRMSNSNSINRNSYDNNNSNTGISAAAVHKKEI
ncbi:unnamed protein product [Sphagnum jensenii]|uniref:Uncharacterized protein n=1 Tax=Sphagnum jensenii TaxID=128206 RepID=A0ABP0V9V6_9BRYO